MKIKSIACLVFNNFESLDLFGPIEVFSHIAEKPKIFLISEDGKPVISAQGQVINCDYSIKDTFHFDMLCIPGGKGTRQEIFNKPLIQWIKEDYSYSRIIFSICTGSALLAATGLLNDKKATSNKKAFDWVKSTNLKVNWVKKARWVKAENIYTSSGVSAGIDASLGIVSDYFGVNEAKKIAVLIEYIWNENPDLDPFSDID